MTLVEPLTWGLAHLPGGKITTYAIAFDLDQRALRDAWVETNSTDPTNAYRQIRSFLKDRGFRWKQGSVLFGDETVTPVTTVLAAQDLARQFPWFARAVKDIRMLRIEDNNDLAPAIRAVAPMPAQDERPDSGIFTLFDFEEIEEL